MSGSAAGCACRGTSAYQRPISSSSSAKADDPVKTSSSNKLRRQCLLDAPLSRGMTSQSARPHMSLQADTGHGPDAVGNLLVAGQTCRGRDQDTLVIEVDDVFFVKHPAGDLLVKRLAFLEFAGEPRPIQRGIDVLVANAADVLWRL